jgi:hypothetical protein
MQLHYFVHKYIFATGDHLFKSLPNIQSSTLHTHIFVSSQTAPTIPARIMHVINCANVVNDGNIKILQ